MIYPSPQSQMFIYGPNLEIVKHVSDAYLEQAAEEPDKNEHILTGHRNFLLTANPEHLADYRKTGKVPVALKGASEAVRQFFFTNMSSRAAKLLVEDMQAMGPVRLRDVDEAQALLVNLAKDLAAKGEIMISKNRADEELIY